jgi:tryptophan-rich sensory protein
VTDNSLFKRATEEAGGSLEGLVYAVGSINLKSLQRLTEADFLADYRLNALGAALSVQAALWVTFAAALNFSLWRMNTP